MYCLGKTSIHHQSYNYFLTKIHIHKFANNKTSFLFFTKSVSYLQTIKSCTNKKAVRTVNECTVFNVFSCVIAGSKKLTKKFNMSNSRSFNSPNTHH